MEGSIGEKKEKGIAGEDNDLAWADRTTRRKQ